MLKLHYSYKKTYIDCKNDSLVSIFLCLFSLIVFQFYLYFSRILENDTPFFLFFRKKIKKQDLNIKPDILNPIRYHASNKLSIHKRF